MPKPTLVKQVLLGHSLRHVWLCLVFVACVLLNTFFASPPKTEAATSGTINFQARLLTAGGALVPDGFYNAQFKLYEGGSTTGGGTQVWSETYYDSNGATAGNDNRVRVVNGYLTVNLGSQSAFSSSMHWDQEHYLTMNIGGTTQTATPTWDGEMSPRLKLTAVPYALSAGQLQQTNGSNTSTLGFATQNAANSILLPDASGTVCLQGAAACGFATGTAASYIQNQNASQQSTSNFWISGTGRADTALQAPLFDTATSTALAIGTTNASSINLNQNTSLAAGKSLTVVSNATTQTGAAQIILKNSSVNKAESGRIRFTESTDFAGAFIWYDGVNNAFNIGVHDVNDSSAANDKNSISIARQTGAVTLQNSSDSTAAFSIQNAATTPVTLFTADTQNMRVGIGTTTTPTSKLEVFGASSDSTGIRVTSSAGNYTAIYSDSGEDSRIDSTGTNNDGLFLNYMNGKGVQLGGPTADSAQDLAAFTVYGNSLFARNTNSTTAFRIQEANTTNTENLFTADTTNKRIIIGSGGDATKATLLVVDNVPTANLPTASSAINGAIAYDSTTNNLKCVINSVWVKCDGSSTTLQNAYDATGGNTITTPTSGSARDLTVTLSDSSGTDSNFLVNIASGSSSKFAVQSAGSDTFKVAANGDITATGTYNSNTFTSSALTFGAASSASISSAASQSLTVTGANGLSLQATAGTVALNGAASSDVNIGASLVGGAITIGGTGAQTGTIALGTGTGAQSINLGTGGTGAKTVTLGSTASSSSVAIQAGTGAITIQNQGTGAISIANNAVDSTINIGKTGTTANTSAVNIGTSTGGAQTVAIGSSNSGSSVSLTGGSTSFTVNNTNASVSGSLSVSGTYNSNTFSSSNLTFGASSAASISSAASQSLTVTGANALSLQATSGDITINGATSTNIGIGASLTTGAITIGGTGAQTGGISLGTGTGVQAIDLGTGGTGAKTVTLGSTASSSSTTIQGGTGAITIQNQGTGAINIANNGVNSTINIGKTGSAAFTTAINLGTSTGAAQTVTAGSSNSGSSVSLTGGATSLTVNNTNASVTGNLSVSGTYNTNTFTSSSLVFGAAGTATIQAASGQGLSIDAGTTATLNLGNSSNNKTINIGVDSATANTTAVNIGTSTGAAQTIKIGGTGTSSSTSHASTTVTFQGGATVATVANAGVTVKSYGNAAAALLVQNSSNVSLLTADASATKVQIGSSSTDSTGVLLVLDSFNSATEPTEVDGAMYYNTALNSFRCGRSSVWVDCNTGLVKSNTSVSSAISNTAAETNFDINYSMPANSCTPGRVYRIFASGVYSTTSTPSLDFRMKVGTTVLGATTQSLATQTGASNQQWYLEFRFICITAGASGTVEPMGRAVIWTTNTSSTATHMGGTATVTIDTTAAQTLQLSADWSVGSTSNTVTMRQFLVESLGPS
jgi:hypothetical protein